MVCFFETFGPNSAFFAPMCWWKHIGYLRNVENHHIPNSVIRTFAICFEKQTGLVWWLWLREKTLGITLSSYLDCILHLQPRKSELIGGLEVRHRGRAVRCVNLEIRIRLIKSFWCGRAPDRETLEYTHKNGASVFPVVDFGLWLFYSTYLFVNIVYHSECHKDLSSVREF